MHCHCCTNNRAQQWTFTDPCKREGETRRPRGVSVSCLASRTRLECPRHNESIYIVYGGLTLDVERHYIGSVTATTHQEKGILSLESNPSRGTVLPAPHGKGNKWTKFKTPPKTSITQRLWTDSGRSVE